MTLLESINSPSDLRALQPDQLRTVADEIRAYILETMSRVGGHTGASLGAVELAVALHYAFDTHTIDSFGTSATRLTRTRFLRAVAICCRLSKNTAASAV